MRYVIYTRVSTNKQTVENQLKECRDYVNSIKERGDEVIEFSEPDSSTRKPMEKRVKLVKMMASLREGDEVVVYKVDRFARKPQELINIYFDIRKKGVKIFGLKDPNINDEMICVYAFIACTERNNIITRTISGLNRKRANMERVGATWYGYGLDETKISNREGCKSQGKPYMLIPDDRESEQVALMIDWHREGMSYGEIANALESIGHKNRKGNPIHKMTVYRVLQRLEKQHQAPMEKVCV